jgi:hypothetical protein
MEQDGEQGDASASQCGVGYDPLSPPMNKPMNARKQNTTTLKNIEIAKGLYYLQCFQFLSAYLLKVLEAPVRPFVTVNVPFFSAETLIHFPSGESRKLAINSSGELSSGAFSDQCNW